MAIMSGHYKQVASEFNKLWSFTDEYKAWAVDRIGKHLDLKTSDIFVDIGGGTGTFTDLLSTRFKPKKSYCVEPEEQMCSVARSYESFETICGDAFSFTLSYSKVLFKEVIHHIEDRDRLFSKIFASIDDGGALLIYTRPQEIRFPLFEKAKEQFYVNQPDYNIMVEELRLAGFSVEVVSESFTFKLPREEWHAMLRSRFMSDLRSFSDDEIEEGIKEIECESYTLEDVIIFIKAYKA